MKLWTNSQMGYVRMLCVCGCVVGAKSFGQSNVNPDGSQRSGASLFTRPTVETGPRPPTPSGRLGPSGPVGGNGLANSGVTNQNVSSQFDAAESAGFPSEAAKQQEMAQIDSLIRGLQQAGAADPSHPQHQAYLLALEGRQRAARTRVNPAGGKGASGNVDALRQTMDHRQQQAQQQMAADNAHYAAMREKGVQQLERSGKNALAALDAIDAEEAGSRRSAGPGKGGLSAEQIELNAWQDTLSKTYQNMAGEQWATPSALENPRAEAEQDNPDSLVPPLQSAPNSDYRPRGDDLAMDPDAMTPRERTQLYTEVDKAFHDKYPEYGDGPIDPETNPEAARKWLDERNQLLASRDKTAPGESGIVKPVEQSPTLQGAPEGNEWQTGGSSGPEATPLPDRAGIARNGDGGSARLPADSASGIAVRQEPGTVLGANIQERLEQVRDVTHSAYSLAKEVMKTPVMPTFEERFKTMVKILPTRLDLMNSFNLQMKQFDNGKDNSNEILNGERNTDRGLFEEITTGRNITDCWNDLRQKGGLMLNWKSGNESQ